MIEIKNKSREFTKVEEYLMTKSNTCKPIKEVDDGEVLNVTGYIEYTDTKENGDVSDLIAIITEDNKTYAAQSKTFRNSLKDIFEIMDMAVVPIKKVSGVTKSDRHYVDCELYVEGIVQ